MKRKLVGVVLALALVFSFSFNVVSADLPGTEPLSATLPICLCEDCLPENYSP